MPLAARTARRQKALRVLSAQRSVAGHGDSEVVRQEFPAVQAPQGQRGVVMEGSWWASAWGHEETMNRSSPG